MMAIGVNLSMFIGESFPLTAGLAHDFDPSRFVYSDAGSTLATNGQAVAQWDAASGGTSLTQGDASRRPVWIASGLNSLPVLRFVATTASDSLQGTFATTLTQPMTIFIVYKFNTLAAGYNDIILDGLASSRFFQGARSVNTGYKIYAGTQVVGGAVSTAAFHYSTLIVDTTSSDFRVDGAAVSTGVSLGTNTLPGITLGDAPSQVSTSESGGGFAGDIARVLLYKGKLASHQILAMESWLAKLYAL